MAFKASVDGGPKPAHQLYGIISICIFYICINRIYIYIVGSSLDSMISGMLIKLQMEGQLQFTKLNAKENWSF